ncbi:hypothetical protein N7450_011639 [Penicillium hetheringtonii]|uniref:Uncharacterized protein n=1 Tax=Penicillium hetheringtonii TaxID=911720 RepID=A0AAD6DAN0_9EURO|nr:hypothetical protein N7450_011639 [Penicillium hetheringtonii]
MIHFLQLRYESPKDTPEVSRSLPIDWSGISRSEPAEDIIRWAEKDGLRRTKKTVDYNCEGGVGWADQGRQREFKFDLVIWITGEDSVRQRPG